MSRKLWIAAALFAPAAWGQTYYDADRLVAPDGTLTREGLALCMDHDRALGERRYDLQAEQADIDRENAAIAREGAALAEELRTLDSRDVAAVNAYNARSAAHNARVDAHNRRVAGSNARSAAINRDTASIDALCARPFWPGDRDAILQGRGSLR